MITLRLSPPMNSYLSVERGASHISLEHHLSSSELEIRAILKCSAPSLRNLRNGYQQLSPRYFGTRSCNVKVCPSGATSRRHIEQLQSRFSRCDDNADPRELPEKSSSCKSFTTQPAEDVTVAPTIIAATGSNRDLPAVPTRRSQRSRKPPGRLNL